MKKRLFKIKILLLLVLLTFYVLLPIPLVQSGQIYYGSEILTVDGFVSELDEWQEVGAFPYINTDDNETSYIWNDHSHDDQKYFTFEDIVYAIKIDSVFLYIKYWDLIGNQYLDIRIWHETGDTGVYSWDLIWSINIPASVWTLKSKNITSWVNKTIEVDNFRIWFDCADSSMERRITYSYLNITGLMQKPRSYHIRHLFGLLGLAIMVITPTYTIWEIKRNKNYWALGTALILVCIGYSFLLVWLTP